MKKSSSTLFTSLILFAASVLNLAATITSNPMVVDFNGNRCVSLNIADNQGDSAWMSYAFTPISLSDAEMIVVTFDIYRDYGDGWAENVRWNLAGDLSPSSGAQWDNPYGAAITYPLGWSDEPWNNQFSNTVFDQFTTMETVWDLTASEVTTSYAGGFVHLNYPISNTGTSIERFDLSLSHDSDTGHGNENAYIDNLGIIVMLSSGADETYFFDFEDFSLGLLDGQNGMASGSVVVVPEAKECTWITSLLAIVFFFKRRQSIINH